jgi:glycosyltransferase involved in cell wall biosynthesis
LRVALHVDQLWFSAPGGIGTYVREVMRALVDHPEEPEVVPFHARWPSAPPDEPPWPSTPVDLGRPISQLYPAWDTIGRPELPEALTRCDVVHATNHAAVPPAGPAALVVTVHDLAFERFPELFPRHWRLLYRAGLRATIRRADAIAVPSGSTASDLIEHGADPSRIHVTPLASSLAVNDSDPDEVLVRLGIEGPFVLFVGTLEPRKNVVRLVRAYRQVAAELPHSLVLAGPDGWHGEELAAELSRPGPGRIVRTGRLPGDELDALYRRADVLAYPSIAEGFGLPVLEAMQRGLPVVTSNGSSLPEVAGQAAVLVEPEDVGGIADAIAEVLTDGTLAKRLREAGTERAAGFSWEATATATLGAYRAAMEVRA